MSYTARRPSQGSHQARVNSGSSDQRQRSLDSSMAFHDTADQGRTGFHQQPTQQWGTTDQMFHDVSGYGQPESLGVFGQTAPGPNHAPANPTAYSPDHINYGRQYDPVRDYGQGYYHDEGGDLSSQSYAGVGSWDSTDGNWGSVPSADYYYHRPNTRDGLALTVSRLALNPSIEDAPVDGWPFQKNDAERKMSLGLVSNNFPDLQGRAPQDFYPTIFELSDGTDDYAQREPSRKSSSRTNSKSKSKSGTRGSGSGSGVKKAHKSSR